VGSPGVGPRLLATGQPLALPPRDLSELGHDLLHSRSA